MLTRFERGARLLFALALILGAVHVVGPGHDVEADEDQQRRKLLVKVHPKQVQHLVHALRRFDAEIHDLDSMKRLDAHPTPAGAGAPAAALADAGALWRAVDASLAGLPLEMRSLVIQERRASFDLKVTDAATLDKARSALDKSAHLRMRGATVEVGAMQRLPGALKQRFSLRLPEGRTGRVSMPAFRGSMHKALIAAGHQVQAQLRYAGREVRDPNRGEGYETVSREFTFGTTTVGGLRTIIDILGKQYPALTVSELRWSLDAKEAGGDGAAIKKPTLRLGWRQGL